MNSLGVDIGYVVNETENLYSQSERLPDIVSYLQNETQIIIER
jgi:hypothetical protein